MHCKSCDYPLWGVAARECPECGAPFKPGEFEFGVGDVRFACPHCGTAYFGTAAHGHLAPSSFNCVQCHRPVTMDEMVVTPTGGLVGALDETAAALPRNVWLHRGEAARVPTFVATIVQLLVRPATFGQSLPRVGHAAAAWKFAFFCILAATAGGTVVSLGVTALLGSALGAFGAFSGFGSTQSLLQLSLIAVAQQLAYGLLFTPIAILLIVPVMHLVVMMLAKRRGPLVSTLQTQLYAMGILSLFRIPGSVPVVGAIASIVGFVWYIMISTHLLSRVHRMGGFQALVASIAPTAGCCAGCAGLVALLLGGPRWIAAQGGTAPVNPITMGTPASWTQPSSDAALLALAQGMAQAQAAMSGVKLNPIDMAEMGMIDAQTLLQCVGAGQSTPLRLGGIPIHEFGPNDPGHFGLSTGLDARLPADDAAFRIGGAAFYYRASLAGTSGDEIIVILGARDDQSYRVVTQTGVQQMSTTEVDAMLERVNAKRAAQGRPPLLAPRDLADLADPPVPNTTDGL